MKFSAVAVVLGAGALVAAQGDITAVLKNMTPCVQNCVTPVFPDLTKCPTPDVPACICKDENFITAVVACVTEKCSADDFKVAAEFAKGVCGTDVTKDIPAPPAEDDKEEDDKETDEDADETTETPTTSGNATVPVPSPTGTETSPPDSDSAAGSLMVSGFSLVGAAVVAALML